MKNVRHIKNVRHRTFVLFLGLLLIGHMVYANECIINTTTNIVREWTAGVYKNPKLNSDEEIKTFSTIPFDYTKVLIYENGDITVTNTDIPIINKQKEDLLILLDNPDVKQKVKDITKP